MAPPAPPVTTCRDPYARGKGPDKLSLEELEEPLIDAEVRPGQLLYIPAGFPHTTHTQEGSREASVHLTVGLDTHIWGLDYAFVRELALRRQKQKTLFHLGGTDRDATALEKSVFLSLLQPLPLGFLGSALLSHEPATASRLERAEADVQAIVNTMAEALAAKMIAAEPDRFVDEVSVLVDSLHLRSACAQIVLHYRKVMDIQRRMYLDGKHALTPAPSSLARAQNYMSLLDGAMQDLLNWSAGSTGMCGYIFRET